MAAFAVTLGLFLLWSAFGLAALVAVRADVRDLRVVLAAPILGTALTVLPLFVLSNAGLGMEAGARPVILFLSLAAALILVRCRPRLPPAVLPVAVLCLLELLLVGRPMFRFGFDWLANANGDMAYYVLSATHLLGNGLRSAVDYAALADNRGFPNAAQELNLRGLRPGAQITLAGLAALTGRPPVALYMPMSIAVAMATVSATGSLAMQAARRWWAAPLASALLVASPMAGYSVVQQLLPQAWGLGLAAALFAWLMRREVHERRPRLADLVVISLLAAALFVVAYEVASALLLAYAAYVVMLFLRRRVSLPAVALLWVCPVIVTVAVLGAFLPRAVRYLTGFVFEFGTSEGFEGLSQFGYAVVPTALPGALGLVSLFASPQTSDMSFFIILAAAVWIGVLLAAVATARTGAAAGVSTLALGALGIMLARNGNEFGLFKLYMYGQPFVAATIAIFVSNAKSRALSTAVVSVAVVVVGLQLSTLNVYVRQSFNPFDLRNASAPDLLPEFRRLVQTSTLPVVAVANNFALLHLQGASAGDRQVFFIGRDVFGLRLRKHQFEVPSPLGDELISFRENPAASRAISRGRCIVSLPTGSQIALNRRPLPEGSANLAALPCRSARNLLAFTASSLGQPSTLPADRRVVSLWQLEPDPWYRNRTFSGSGRFALFRVLGPTRSVRMVLDYTVSPTNTRSGSRRIPPARAVGSTVAAFPVLGDGSARVVSPPLEPRMIDGQPYVVLDMGKRGALPVVPRPGVTGLWGRSVTLDPRTLTSYVRDISLISAGEYADFRPPVALQDLPADLANPDLEYSGIAEDGWVGRISYARLSGGPSAWLHVQADVLPLRGGQRLEVLVDGRRLVSRRVSAGPLELRIRVPAKPVRRRIELRWAGVSRLAAPDTRRAAARLRLLGIR